MFPAKSEFIVMLSITVSYTRDGDTDLLHNLLLLDQERTHDTVLDTVRAAGTTIGTLDGLLGFGDLRVLARAERGDLWGGVVSIRGRKLTPFSPRSSTSFRGYQASEQSRRTQTPIHPKLLFGISNPITTTPPAAAKTPARNSKGRL